MSGGALTGGRLIGLTLLAAAAWLVVAAACLLVGSTGLGLPAGTLAFRLEPVAVASLVGAGLACAGVGYQAVLRNPLADPYLLGAAGGAALAALLWDVLPAGAVAGLGRTAAAFAGALLAVGAVLGLTGWRGRLEPGALVLVGVIVNATCGAALVLVWTIFQSRPGGDVLGLLVGAIRTTLPPGQVALAAALLLVVYGVLAWRAGGLNALALGEDEAAALGVAVGRARWVTIVAASLLTAAAVALSGPIGFVGLICPHLGRLLVGGDVRRLLPVATALGAALLATADAAGRGLGHDAALGRALPVGVLTALLGGPFFLLMLWRRTPTT